MQQMPSSNKVSYYAAILPRRGRILRHTLSVRLSVRPVIVAIATSVTRFRQPCGRAVSFVLFTCQGRIYSTAISAAQACWIWVNDSQHGFISKKSCLTTVICYIFEIVTDYVDNGCPVDVLYLDFQKAFDKVPHQRLLSKRGIGNYW